MHVCMHVFIHCTFVLHAVSSLSIDCPNGQYPYGGCSSCFNIPDKSLKFDDAAQFCQDSGGSLISVRDKEDFEQLIRYLEGLSEDRILWTGYKYSTTGVRIAVDGELAPEVIQDDRNFAVRTTGTELTCVAVQGAVLVNIECSRAQSFACMYSYEGKQVIAVYACTHLTGEAVRIHSRVMNNL